jgi:hypothetical protein
MGRRQTVLSRKFLAGFTTISTVESSLRDRERRDLPLKRVHGGREMTRDCDGDAKRPSSTSFMADGDRERSFFRKLFAGRRPISRIFMIEKDM